MRKTLIVIGVIVFLIGFFWVLVALQNADQQYIEKWAADNHYVVKEAERCYFYKGPYWFSYKSDRIYKVKTEDKVFWFRFRFWSINLQEE